MFKHLFTFAFALILLAGKTHAADPSVGLIVPYKVACVKQSDGTQEIRFSVLLRTSTKKLVFEGQTIDKIDTDTTLTHALQSKASCSELDHLFEPNQKLFGFDAIQVGIDTQHVFNFPSTQKNGMVCAYLIKLHSCCKTPEEALIDHVLLEDTDVLEWVDVGTIFSAGDNSSVFATYVTDLMLFNNLFDTGTGSIISIVKKVCSTAVLNFHGKPCCFETFGLNEEAAKSVLSQIVKAFDQTPGNFTASGTFGSCGDTSNVTVTGNRTSAITINVCGKKLCMVGLDSVAKSDGTFAFGITNVPGFPSTRCFWSFIRDYLNYGFNTINTATPPFMTYGLQDELCRLLDGRAFHRNDGQDYTFQLRLFCVDPLTHTYALAITEESEAGRQTFVTILGCRFTLDECKKCCK